MALYDQPWYFVPDAKWAHLTFYLNGGACLMCWLLCVIMAIILARRHIRTLETVCLIWLIFLLGAYRGIVALFYYTINLNGVYGFQETPTSLFLNTLLILSLAILNTGLIWKHILHTPAQGEAGDVEPERPTLGQSGG